MKLRHVLFFFVIAAVVQFGCGSKGSSSTPADKAAEQDSTNSQQSDTNATGSPQMSQSNDPGIPIEVTPVTRGEISSYLLYNSTLETEQMADVFARIQGIAEKIYVEEGDRVSRNQALLQIEEEEYALAEQKARLEYDTKLSEFKRFEALKDKNLISEEEFDNARLAVRQAELAWKQAKLNLEGVNVIRVFPGEARPVIWGSRTTVSTDTTDWIYINVRRLMLYIEESLQKGIRWAVFEPNNLFLWQKLKRTITEFLTRVWRSGALFGAKPEEAFYVRIDEALNPDSVRALGRLYIEIGVRVSYPAEFIIIRIGLWDGGAEVSES